MPASRGDFLAFDRQSQGRHRLEKPKVEEAAMHRIRGLQPTPALVLASIAIIIACAGSATAASLITGKQIKNGTIKGEDLSKTLRERLGNVYIAKVGGDGGLISQRGIKSVTHPGAGDFQVTLRKSVERCAAVATVRGTAEVEVHGFITTYTPAKDVIRVVLRNPGGNQVDGAGFNLVVVC
jgi:hypothetical protein